MEVLRHHDIDPSPLDVRRVAIIGFGNQGRAQALNLKDSGVDVLVGLRESSLSKAIAEELGLRVATIEEAVAGAEIVMLLVPDEVLGDLYVAIEPHLSAGVALGFSHGLAVHFGLVRPRADLDVFLMAPKGPGRALRSLYRQGDGMPALWAVAQDASGCARDIALAYGRAIGCARAGLIMSSFAEECEADLFNEHAVVWGAVPEILLAGFDTLVAAGVTPEVAYLECVGELRLLAELIDEHGIAAMRESISNTAELGATLGGKRVVDEGVRARMQEILADIRSGNFVEALKREVENDYAGLQRARSEARQHPSEDAGEKLKILRPKS